MLTQSKYKLLCIKALQNDISECELETLNRLIEKSPKKREEFDQMKKLWNSMDSVPVNPPAVDVKKEWEFFDKKFKVTTANNYIGLNIWDKLSDKIKNIITLSKYLYLKPAYSITVLIMLIITYIVIYQNTREEEIRFQTFTAANKQKVNVQLTDGSSIKLNSGSSITVQDEFSDDKREVKLTGEAYFDVAKEKRPCIIVTDNAKIEVLGTSFNVWSRNNQTRVIVKEGVVRLSSLKSDDDFVLIQADQISQVIEDKSPLEAKHIQADRYLGWPEGKLVFEHCPLDEFIGEIERQYNINVDLQSEDMKDLKLSGTFDNLTTDQVLASVCLTFNYECDQIHQDTYILKQK